MKTSDLTGPALDWAVAKCEKHQSRCEWMIKEGWSAWQSYEAAWGNPIPHYSNNWTQGGPIIERERITLRVSTAAGAWVAFYDAPYNVSGRMSGHTPLIAAMRTYVTSKLGDEIEIPPELESKP